MNFTLSTGKTVNIYIDDVAGDGWYMYVGENEAGKVIFAEHARANWLVEKSDCAETATGISQEEYAEICRRIDETVAALALAAGGNLFYSNYGIDGHDIDNNVMKTFVEKVF